MADWTDPRVLLPLLDALVFAVPEAWWKEETVDAHGSIALACCVCTQWRATITAWRATVRSLLLVNVSRSALRVVARQYPRLQRLELRRRTYESGMPEPQCTFRGSHADLLAACRELLTGCPQLVHINLRRVPMQLTAADQASLLAEFLLDKSCKAKTPPREIEVGARVSVDFDGIPFPGMVQGKRRPQGKRVVLFTVLFEDGSRHNDITRGEMTPIPWPGAGVARAGLEILFFERPRPGTRGSGGRGLGKGDIGSWEAAPAAASASPSEQLLLGRTHEQSLTAEHMRAIAAAADGPPPPPWAAATRFFSATLTERQCTDLVVRADAEFAAACADGRAAPADMKIDLARAELDTVVGAGSATRLLALGVAVLQPQHVHLAPHFILRRRCVLGGSGSRERIVFHRDHSLAVVSVALNDDFRGGRLLFALGGRVTCPERPIGSALAHNDAAVHGVSSLATGARYHLFVVYDRPAPAA